MLIRRLTIRRGARSFTVVVMTPDRARRRRIARAFIARGWLPSRVAFALRIRGEAVAGLLAEPKLFDPALLKEAARATRRMVAL